MELLGDTGHVESHFFLFEDRLLSVQDGCTVCAKRTIDLEIDLDAHDVLPGDEAQVKAHFVPFGDSANLDARQVHGLRRTYHRNKNCFGCPVELLGDVGHVESHFFPF
jgi:hypothetical protein